MSRSIRGASAILVAACCLLMFLGLTTHRAVAQPLDAGTAVVFFLLADGLTPADGPQERLIFTGQQATIGTLPGCATGTGPVQEAVLVNLNGQGQQSSHTVTVFVISQAIPVPAGTRVSGLSGGTPCTSGGVGYLKYTGGTE